MKRVILPLVLASLLLASIGCLESLEAEPAKPALVDSSALEEQGWKMTGEPDIQSQTVNVAGQTATISLAMTQYTDKQMVQDISESLGEMGAGPQEMPASALFTIRVNFPGGLTAPTSIVSRFIDEQIGQMTREMNIQDLQLTSKDEWTINTGKTATVQTYAGTIYSNGVELPVKIIAANWNTEGSTIITVALIPNGDIKLPQGLSIPIDTQKEYNEVKTLIQTVS